ncbi:MAG TPA: FtsX-like permease family protein [Pseudomonadales bacterium]
MNTRLSWMLALRYAGWRGNGLGRFISRLAMAGFVIGVAVLITVLSVMNGFERELRERILSVMPAITVTRAPLHDWPALKAEIISRPDVRQAMPFVQSHALISQGSRTEGGLLYGVALDQPDALQPYAPYLRPADALSSPVSEDALLLGAALARRLGVAAGDRINIFVSEDHRQGVRTASLRIVGLIESGTELDEQLMVASLDTVSRLKFGEAGFVDGLRLQVTDVLAAPEMAFKLYYDLQGRYAVSDWTRTHGNLYEAISMSKRLVALVLIVLVLVAGFNVVSGLVMLVNEKRTDIAILKTMGLSPRRLMGIFTLQGSLLGSVGVLLGVIVGVLLSLSIPSIVAGLESLLGIQFLSSSIYPVSFLPSELKWQDVVLVAAVSFLISATVSLYPAWQAARVMPADSLRHE